MELLQGDPRLLGRVEVRALDRNVLFPDVDEDGHSHDTDLVIVPVFRDERPLLGLAGYVDWRSSGKLGDILRRGFGEGDLDENVLTCGFRSVPFRRVVLLGLGHSGRFDRELAQSAAGRVVRLGLSLAAESLAVSVPAGMVSRELCESFGLALGQRLAALDEPHSHGHGSAFPERVRVYVPEDWVSRFLRLLAGPPRPADAVD